MGDDAVGVKHFDASSTFFCEVNYGKVLAEMSELLSIAGNRVTQLYIVHNDATQLPKPSFRNLRSSKTTELKNVVISLCTDNKKS